MSNSENTELPPFSSEWWTTPLSQEKAVDFLMKQANGSSSGSAKPLLSEYQSRAHERVRTWVRPANATAYQLHDHATELDTLARCSSLNTPGVRAKNRAAVIALYKVITQDDSEDVNAQLEELITSLTEEVGDLDRFQIQ